MYASTFALIVLYTGPYGIFHPSPKKGIKGKKKRKEEKEGKKKGLGPASRDVIDHTDKAGNLGRKHIIRGDDANACCCLSRRDDPRKSKVKQRKKREKNLLA